MSSVPLNLRGNRYGKLVAMSSVRDTKRPRFLWECVCDCGGSTVTTTYQLRNGLVRSCGCLRTDAAKRAGVANTTHGMSNSRAFRIWTGMKTRCLNKSDPGYKNYGGRGISIAPEWLESFSVFLFDMGEPSSFQQIDRINNDGNYCKENCRWVTSKINANNRRSSRIIEFNGQIKTLAEWAESIGITRSGLARRIDVKGWDISRALTERNNHG